MTTKPLIFSVHGTAGPQGSKRALGRGRMVESSTRVRPWREAVKHAALDKLPPGWQPLTGPVAVRVSFAFPRPKGHYRTGRNAHLLRDGAAEAPTSRNSGDIDKLLRSSFDALTDAGVWGDDAQVARVEAVKGWAESGPACALFRITSLAAVSPDATATPAPTPASAKTAESDLSDRGTL